MSQHIRDRIQRKLGTLSDERLYQVLDFVEFLELKYPAAQATAPANPLQRFADGIEDRLRAGGLAATTVSEAMGFLNKAVGVLGNVASVAQTAAQRVGDTVTEVAQSVQATGQPGAPRPPAGTGPATADPAAPLPAAVPPPTAPPAPPPASPNLGDRPQ
jgi:hypothetical protein